MKSILVATDLSHRSDRAVQRALRLASSLDVPCHVISVVDADQPSDFLEGHKNLVERRLERFVTNDAAPDQAVVTEVMTGDPRTVIPDRAHVVDAGAVVLGLHRMRPFLDLLRETIMERLVRSSLRPVLPGRDPADHDYRKVPAPASFPPPPAPKR